MWFIAIFGINFFIKNKEFQMSFYRTFIAAVAAMGLASVAFAADTTDATKQQTVKSVEKTATKTTTAEAQQTGDTTSAEKVNINKATAKELAKVKGMTVSKARAIVSYRKKNGDFKSIEDLKQVKGFKKMDEKTMKDLEDQLTVG